MQYYSIILFLSLLITPSLVISGDSVTTSERDGTLYLSWFEAAQNGHLDTISNISSLVDINAKDEKGNTALHLACWKGHHAIVSFLIHTETCNINMKDGIGRTGLYLAAEWDHDDIFSLILDWAKPDVNIKTDDGWTVLHFVAGKGYISMLEQLLEVPDLIIDAIDTKGLTPLDWARDSGNADAINLLIKKLTESRSITTTIATAMVKTSLSAVKSVLVRPPARAETCPPKSKIVERPQIKYRRLSDTGMMRTRQKMAAKSRDFDDEKSPAEDSERNEIKEICSDRDSRPLAPIFGKSRRRVMKDLESNKRDLNIDNIACAYCKKDNCIKRCSGCRQVYYCSTECQTSDWMVHKYTCDCFI